ncbi:hypothetical protein GQ464_002220 [Rhodocaloribacter litoris]|uniref:S24 family peptidase n=1 Tax=Rhodocaloribacter litoris TaxID=2558931 RepID=UPI001423B971|nr:LexA family transcriptional regulator [Rhodocaloribacter litoris]QXD15785.1 hypothetical protein GQ464_002220 [Rhodocaloribacter litoris]
MPRVKKVIDPELFVRRVGEAMTRLGLTQEALAEAIEARIGSRPGQSTVSNWTRGEKLPGTKYLPVLVEILGLSWSDLGLEGGVERDALVPPSEGRRPPVERDGARPGFDPSRIVLIPRVGHASAGHGYDNDASDPALYDAFSRDEIARLTNTDPDRLRSIKVVGDSMEPEIRANDTVVYEPVQAVSDAGIYVLRLDDLALVKKVQRFGGGVLEIIPVNPAYRSEMLRPLPEADTPNTYRSEVTGMTCTCEVIGKVVFYLRPA